MAASIASENTINPSRPIVWSIAASDSGGGAGIQADLNTIHSLECHGCTIITAITAQNSIAVEKIHPISAVDLAAQWQALEKDLLPKAIKIGLLPEPNTLRWLARHIQKLRLNQKIFCVWDPVLKASTGARFLDAFDRGEIDPLLKQVDLITPNLQEAEALTKIRIKSFDDITLAAKQLLDRGVKNVLIKGGHSFDQNISDNASFCRDYFVSSDTEFWLSHRRQEQPNNHGTGCTLASAIACFVAQEHPLSDSIVLANRFIQQGLRLAAPQGKGAGPVWQTRLEHHPEDLSELTKTAESFLHSVPASPFPQTNPLGIYAIVNTVEEAERLIKQGVDTLQWRDKSNKDPKTKTANIKQVIKLCRQGDIPLFINDDWQLALELKAYGVHLGQEDLEHIQATDLAKLHQQGMRLGISCHNETELAYAHSLQPSYVAFGPVFSTQSKQLNHPSLGLAKLEALQSCYGKVYPTTCIGGIDANNIHYVLATGITSVAVISAVDTPEKSSEFIKAFTKARKN